MKAPDSFRFLPTWTDLLPRSGSAVIAVAGSGGCTTLTLRLVDELRAAGSSVLVTQTTAHPVPFAHVSRAVEETRDAERVLREHGVVWWVGEKCAGDRALGIDTERLEAGRREVGADVVVVQAQSSSASLRTAHPAPVWPLRTDLAVLVAPLWTVGRLWTATTVEGAPDTVSDEEEPRRVVTDDVIGQMQQLVATVPREVRPLPFFTGVGSFRDIDGMFAAVDALWDPPRTPVVCLAELLGDERRDAADRAALAEGQRAGPFDGERVYAVYPASLDDAEGPEV